MSAASLVVVLSTAMPSAGLGENPEAHLSAKHRLFGTRIYFAYTQISFWQAYDIENSAPFGETNYNPEAFYRFREIPRAGWHVGLARRIDSRYMNVDPPASLGSLRHALRTPRPLPLLPRRAVCQSG